MKRISITLCGIALFTLSVWAQQSQVGNNWFISAGAGGSLLCAEQDSEASITGRLKYSGEFSVGKWFNPVLGASFQANIGSLRGFNTFPGENGGQTRGRYEVIPDGVDDNKFPKGDRNLTLPHAGKSSLNNQEGFWQDFNYTSANLNLLVNLTHLMNGYAKELPSVEVIPYIGGGLIHSMEGTANLPYTGLLVKTGIRMHFNLNPSVAIYLEPNANFTGEALDGHLGGRTIDVALNGMVGIQMTFNRSYASFNGGISQEELDFINQRINENRSMIEENRTLIDNHQTIAERQQALLNQLGGRVTDLEERPVSVTANGVGGNYLPDYVRFSLNSYEIPVTEQSKIDEAIRYLKAHSDAKLLLIGYADRKTGSPSSNMTLSKNRVQAIAEELKHQGIGEDRLILQWKGDQEQPFKQNEWNRVVILVAR